MLAVWLLLLAACDRLVVISAVDRPEEADAEDVASDASEGDDAEISEAPNEPPASLDAGVDAGPVMNTPLDARVAEASALDAAGEDGGNAPADAGPDATLPACGGKRVLDLCWYFGAQGASCEQTCRDKGGFDARAIKRVGSEAQGGSLRACAQVLAALGFPGSVIPGYRDDGAGVGCHVWENGDGWWLIMPDFSSAASISVATRACACLR
ncbi:MAG TPA: hypothetical protein VFZ61_19215 [Polyangiales bacterium]